jgi:hypothetical protein
MTNNYLVFPLLGRIVNFQSPNNKFNVLMSTSSLTYPSSLHILNLSYRPGKFSPHVGILCSSEK